MSNWRYFSNEVLNHYACSHYAILLSLPVSCDHCKKKLRSGTRRNEKNDSGLSTAESTKTTCASNAV